MLLFFGFVLHAQQPQVEARIAGLEDNQEYMSLLRQDAMMQQREDSVISALSVARQKLRNSSENRQQISQEIMQMENTVFEIRNAKGRLIDRINAIEQDWVLANLDETPKPKSAATVEKKVVESLPESKKVRNLVDNIYFSKHLSNEDYTALRRAQQRERLAVDYVNRYAANYNNIAELAASYVDAKTEKEANDLYGRYSTLQSLNQVLSDSLSTVWNYIFDNKSYAYGLLMDELGEEPVLNREEQELASARQKLAEMQGKAASEAVADYFLRKRVLVDYEISVADVLHLTSARDSLRAVAAQIGAREFKQPKIEVEERIFIQYDSLAFSSSKYSAQHPIPQTKVYERGTIYRILIGQFAAKRAVSTFKGAYPLSYQTDEEGKYSYYAGGFATRAGAEEGVKTLKAKGFAHPEIVIWSNGKMHNLSQNEDAVAVTYRVEIAGTETLSDAVKQAITENAPERELLRVGQQLFVVGVFTTSDEAEKLATALRIADPALEIKVAEIDH